jgi:hypothetical protein
VIAQRVEDHDLQGPVEGARTRLLVCRFHAPFDKVKA